jgi:hypothetical protein
MSNTLRRLIATTITMHRVTILLGSLLLYRLLKKRAVANPIASAPTMKAHEADA